MEYGYDITQPPTWIGFKNFQRLIEDKTFWQTLKNTVLYLVVRGADTGDRTPYPRHFSQPKAQRHSLVSRCLLHACRRLHGSRRHRLEMAVCRKRAAELFGVGGDA